MTKVYGWQGWRSASRGQTREIVAARSIAEVIRITGGRRSDLFNIDVTGNTTEITQALSDPGTVFWRPLDDYSGEWRR